MGIWLILLSGMYWHCLLRIAPRLIVVAEHTLWLGRPQACLPLIVFWHYLLPMTTLLRTLFRSPSAPCFPASPERSKKVSGQKRPTLRAPRERPKNCCENWTTVYSGHKQVSCIRSVCRTSRSMGFPPTALSHHFSCISRASRLYSIYFE